MKKQLLTKLLLAVAMLGLGTSAWATDVPYNVGTSTEATYRSAASDIWTLESDGVITVTFTNHCLTTGNNWENWILYCGDSELTTSTTNDKCHFAMRSDKWDDVSGSAIGYIVDDDYFTDFKTFQNEATVTLKIVRSGSTVTVNTSVTKNTTTRKMTFVKTITDGTLKFFLTQNLSYMTITAQNQTTEMAGAISANALINFEGNSGVGAKGSIDVYNSNYNDDDPAVLYLRNGSGTLTIDASEYPGSKDIVTVSFDMMFVSMGKAKTAWFALQDKDATEIGGITFDVYSNSFSNNTLGLETGDLKAGSWAHFKITLDYNDNSITTTTSCPGATNATSTHKVTMTNTNPFAKFYVGAGYNANADYQKCRFDNLLIQTEKGDYNTTANITLAFEDNDGADISALYTGTTAFTPEKSTTFTPSDYYPAVMYDEDYKYTYTSGGDAFTVTTDQVVTLVYTKSARPTYTFNVTANYGTKNKKIVDEISVKEAADYTYYYPRFILDGTTLYEYASSTDANASANYWTSTNTNVAANATYTLTYNAIDGECVYYSEGEDVISKTGNYIYSTWKQYMSNGSSGVFSAGTLTSLDAGVYSVTARVIGRASDRYGYIYKSSVEDANKLLTVVSANNGNEATANFTLTESTNIIAEGGYVSQENGHGIDYIYIMKLPSTVSGTITTAGWSTFASPYALNLSTITGGTAYYASTASGNKVTLTQTTATVPAGEGIMVKGTAGETFTIGVAASGTAISGNLLKGQTTTGDVAASTDGTYHYVFGFVTDNPTTTYGFYNLASATEVAAGKAYLETTTQLTADARLAIVFEDDATAIDAIAKSQEPNANSYYDLQGRRVAQPTKGLYIKDGKKVIVK